MLFKKNNKRRVLVADDDEDFLSAIRAVLEFAGFKVDTADDGEAALKEMKKNKYDLLILDLFMPNVDGIKLFQMARKSNAYSSVPVLFVSGCPPGGDFNGQQKEIVDSASGYIQKPFQTKVFLEKVRTVLDGPKAARRTP